MYNIQMNAGSKAFLVCLSLGSGWLPVATADTLRSLPVHGGYQAEYRVYWHGFFAATAKQQVNRLSKNRYTAQLQVKPRFPFIPFEYDEKSLFFDAGRAIQPLNFTFQWREKKEERQGSVDFDWKNKKQDKISLIFQLSRYLETNAPLVPGKKWSHSVVEAKKQKTYIFESLAEESIDTPLGWLHTVKIKQSAENSARHSHLWFAIDADYLLVKIAQFKDNDLIGYTLIEKIVSVQ
jgi:uncharacterized protein DUF3108